MAVNKKSLANLSPIKPGERLALKPESERKSYILAGRVLPSNMATAQSLVKELGSKSKAINHLLENYGK